DGVIRLWLKPRPELPFAGEPLRLRADAQGVNALAFTSDGRRLASAGHDGHVRTWSGTGGQETVALPAARGSEALAFGKGGRRLATASEDEKIRVWNVADGTVERVLEGHNDYALTLAFSPDGQWLVSGGVDRTVRLWDLRDGNHFVLGQHDNWVKTVAFSAD